MPPQKKQKVQVNQITEIRNPQEDEESEQGDVSFNLESYDPSNYNAIDDCVIYYWLADSATTPHTTNQCDAFVSYKPIKNAVVQGVGDLTTHAKGKGTVLLESEVNGNKYIIRLENVLYIPNNHNNLISLGRWDVSGGRYHSGNGTLSLITKDGHTIAKGNKINNHLYQMKIYIQRSTSQSSSIRTLTAHINNAKNITQSWEIWHRCFGHIGYMLSCRTLSEMDYSD